MGHLPSQVVAGVISGSMIGVMALGIVLIYRTARVVNLAQGVMAMAAAFIHARLARDGVPVGWASIVALLFVAALGVIVHASIARVPRERALSRVMLTVAWMTGIQALALLLIPAPIRVPGLLPPVPMRIRGIVISQDQLLLVIVGAVLATGLAMILSRSRLGLQMRAVAQNPEAALMSGVRVPLVIGIAWAGGAVLAGIAGILVAPLTVLDPVSLPYTLLIQALAAALVARLTRLGVAMAAGVGLGVSISVVTGQVTPDRIEVMTALRDSLPLLVVVVALGTFAARKAGVDA